MEAEQILAQRIQNPALHYVEIYSFNELVQIVEAEKKVGFGEHDEPIYINIRSLSQLFNPLNDTDPFPDVPKNETYYQLLGRLNLLLQSLPQKVRESMQK